ncbi:pantoate--beta-alanine ligase [Kiloniella litopenaei]|uniref:Pantothenate synthetase n=1 Tax=Kiloniella litopenaei TaxID=1549748 RepID=A0A0M2RER9_9PROT|nr:pantoate--beta-alanine ligase [Kiloniella litopenaei]KKJ78068.1 pantoate--beta-alanine ligase [Kiloniella litopenaei]
MRIVKSKRDLRALVSSWKADKEEIGVVMTMGALHEGHLSLVDAAKADNDRVIATIFINPKQFDNKTDLDTYPVDTDADLRKLEDAGVDLVYLPQVDEIYPKGYSTTVAVSAMQDCLCGATRPGHMDGVTTVVSKLLIQTAPDRAYFGQKDFQQFLLIQRVAGDLDLEVDVIGVPTVREDDNLALSSRNRRLSEEQRDIAPTLYKVENTIAYLIRQGEAVDHVLEWGRKVILDSGFERIDYLEIRSEEDLELLGDFTDRDDLLNGRVFVAAWLGNTRLIDNYPISR